MIDLSANMRARATDAVATASLVRRGRAAS